MGAARVPDPSTPRNEPVGHRKWWPTGLLAASVVSIAVAGFTALDSGVGDRGAVITEITVEKGSSASIDHLDGLEPPLADEPELVDGNGIQLTTPDRLEALAEASRQVRVEPVQVSIPALDVRSSVVTVGLDENRAVEVPEDIGIVGWYKHAAFPGSDVGSAVLVAHRDGSGGRRGVFYSVGNLEPGDRVEVDLETGGTVVYEVVSRELVHNVDFDANAARLFAVDGAPRLTLISCGGLYDRNKGGYQSNIVVIAEPIQV